MHLFPQSFVKKRTHQLINSHDGLTIDFDALQLFTNLIRFVCVIALNDHRIFIGDYCSNTLKLIFENRLKLINCAAWEFLQVDFDSTVRLTFAGCRRFLGRLSSITALTFILALLLKFSSSFSSSLALFLEMLRISKANDNGGFFIL